MARHKIQTESMARRMTVTNDMDEVDAKSPRSSRMWEGIVCSAGIDTSPLLIPALLHAWLSSGAIATRIIATP